MCFACWGSGWIWDSTDSGSGAMVFCRCVDGARLRIVERFTNEPAAIVPDEQFVSAIVVVESEMPH